ncbi:MAG: DNA-binding response regulator [Deltaproteobacteria bacterium 21-66-5]|nr:MAG: DNA-binding response regulator [Deltaproteobacteria bacterium 21-66-5]
MIRVLLADDHSIVRDGLRRLVDGAGDMVVVAEAADGREAIRKMDEFLPDVAVVDISMPGLDGLEVVARIRRIHAAHPKTAILVLTMHEEEQYVVRTISAGASGYITKRAAADQMIKGIRKVHEGGRYLSDDAAEALARRMGKGPADRTSLDALSTREIQVLRSLALGKSNREIAGSYAISVKTVDTYRFRLLKKLGLRNNAELTRFAIQNRIIEP